jgi:hypothetical protein
MNQWINWLFNSEKPAPTAIKKEGNVYLEGDKAIYCAREGFRQTVIDLNQLQYIYIYTTESCQNLVLNNYSQHFIPCSVGGFEIFFQHLASRFSLDEKKFREILVSKKPEKVELWRANVPDNCKILDFPGTLLPAEKELSDGFWLCTEPRQWISWDMTSEVLAALPLVYQTTSEYGLTEIRSQFPVQIGNLILKDWRYPLATHLRSDVPLDSFYSNVRVNGNGDQNYFLVKDALCKIWGQATTIYERDDQNSCQWMVNGIKFALIYWYDSRFSYQSGYAYLEIKNERNYADYLIDTDYETNIQLSKCLFLDRHFATGSDFRRSRYFQQTPPKVVEQLTGLTIKFVIWLDELNGKVGFANLENAMIFPLDIIASFQCQNVIPDRSSGGTYLSAVLKAGETHSILIGDCNSFDAYVSQLAEMIQLPITEQTTYE